MAILTGCAAQELRDDPAEEKAAEKVHTKATPLVGTWRWSASGRRIGDIDLGEEHFVFRDDGSYAVVSKAGDGRVDCYQGTFTWRAAELGHGTIVFRRGDLVDQAFEGDVQLEGEDTLDFGAGGTYRRTAPLPDLRCP